MDTKSLQRRSIEVAIRVCQGPTALARRIGARQARVSMWLTRGQVANEWARRVSEASSVPARCLRPDTFGEPSSDEIGLLETLADTATPNRERAA